MLDEEILTILASVREEVLREQVEITPMRLLLGLLRAEAARARELLQRLGVDAAALARQAEGRLGEGPEPAPPGDGGFDYEHGTKQVLSYAVDEAREAGQFRADSRHLLLALIRADRDVAALLAGAGLALEQAREAARTQSVSPDPISD